MRVRVRVGVGVGVGVRVRDLEGYPSNGRVATPWIEMVAPFVHRTTAAS